MLNKKKFIMINKKNIMKNILSHKKKKMLKIQNQLNKNMKKKLEMKKNKNIIQNKNKLKIMKNMNRNILKMEEKWKK